MGMVMLDLIKRQAQITSVMGREIIGMEIADYKLRFDFQNTL